MKKLAGIIAVCIVAIIVAIVLISVEPWEPTYTLSVIVNPSQAGSVSPAGGEYESGEQVTLTATPASGYKFDYWRDLASSSSDTVTSNTVTITMNAHKAITAYFKPSESPSVPEEPAEFVNWYEAQNYIGERTTVCGPVVDATWASGSNDKPTFLNLGKPYPDPDRFTVVIWIQNRGNFPQAPEDYYLGKTICVTGLIIEYNWIPEIEVKYPSEIEIQEP
jgi:hypothetical protein